MNNQHCTLYIIHCTLYIVHYTLFIVHSILVHVEEFFQWDADRRIIRIHLHDVCHHIPPFLGDRIHIGGVLAVGIAIAFLNGKEQIGVLVPEDAVVAHTLILDHLFQLWPNRSVALGIFLFASLLEIHLKCKSFHT